jgi:alanine racemase
VQSYPIAHIDLIALKHNLSRVKYFAPKSRVMSVIKANAYGHGMIEVANALANSDAFCVARLSEALSLRESGIEQPIVILEGVNTATELQLAAENSLSLVFSSLLQVELAVTTSLTKSLQFCWLMVETGMHRLGVQLEQVELALQSLTRTDNIVAPIGLMSHFANADLKGDPRNQQQLDTLKKSAKEHNLPLSMANSAAIISFPDSHGDWVRPGIMLYGSSPLAETTAGSLLLKPVMRLSSTLISIQNLQAGDAVGYGGDWVATKTIRIGIVGIGYGDGYPRQLSNTGSVMIADKVLPILGRVSMDMVAIDLSLVVGAKIGDEVMLWGGSYVDIDTIAEQAKTISYELLSQINDRVIREYHHG